MCGVLQFYATGISHGSVDSDHTIDLHQSTVSRYERDMITAEVLP